VARLPFSEAYLRSLTLVCLLAAASFFSDAAARDDIAGPLTGPTSATSAAAVVPGVPRLDHVIVVVMENHSYDEVRIAPYTSKLVSLNVSFSQSFAVAHPSEPNYLALWAASTLGVTDDACPPGGSPYSAENLGHACEAAGLTWKTYCENLPSVGSTDCISSDNLYMRKHHPAPDFANLTHSNECPYSQLATDIAAGQLPNLSFVVPNMCHDTHDCSVAEGDTWLSHNLPAMILAVEPRGLVVLTWDEDDFGSENHILTVFAGPMVKTGYVSPQVFSHYTLVRTLCDVLGLSPFANASFETTPTDIWTEIDAGVGPGSPREGLSLSEPSPNPFRTAITATLGMPSEQQVSAYVVDVSGRRVRSLFAEPRAGNSVISWDGSRDDRGRAAPGLYFLYVRAGGEQVVRTLVLTR